jgi:hypothetical protein
MQSSHYNWITHNATRLATTGMDLVIVKAESDDVKAVRFIIPIMLEMFCLRECIT